MQEQMSGGPMPTDAGKAFEVLIYFCPQIFQKGGIMFCFPTYCYCLLPSNISLFYLQSLSSLADVVFSI